MRKIFVAEKEFNKKIAYIIKIYMKRTTLDFETIKKLLLKIYSQTASTTSINNKGIKIKANALYLKA